MLGVVMLLLQMCFSKSDRSVGVRALISILCLIGALLVIDQPVALASEAEHTHALLINGGGNHRINYQSHLLHIRRIVQLLHEAGVPAGRISILSADGADPEADLATREMQAESEFWLLEGTRLERVLRPRVRYTNSEVPGAVLHAATRENLRLWFERAAGSLGKGDTVLLYVTDHGTLNREDDRDNRITLWGEDESIGVAELGKLISLLQPSVRVVALMSQCFSGSFANLIFGDSDSEMPRPNLGGFFSSTADRPAYGCYPENRDKYNVGHSFRFFDALDSGGDFSTAHTEVLVTDRTPDVPLRASDFYLESIIRAGAETLGMDFEGFVDQLLKKAWQDKGTWETEIRLLDRIGESFGYFSPRYLSELTRHSEALTATGKRLEDYETAWRSAQQSLNQANLERFLDSRPDWSTKLTVEAVKSLSENERDDLTGELLAEIEAYIEQDPPTASRLKLLRARADATAKASYRMEVRQAAVLRMRIVLISIAGRQYLDELGSDAQREAWVNLAGHETFALSNRQVSGERELSIEAFPPFEDEVKLAESALPGWMGIQFRPVYAERKEEYQLNEGAVSVLAVFPNSPAQQAGLQAGDIIIGSRGQPFAERNFVREWVMTAPIGEPQTLQVRRAEELLTVSLTPEPYPMEWPSLPGPPQVGSPAPPVSDLEMFRGRTLSELKEQGPYLLFFWATWCGPCKAALPELIAFEQERNTRVLAITDEPAESVERFLQTFQGPFPEAIALDENRRSFLNYGVSGTPRFVLVDDSGTIRSSNSGYRRSKGLQIDGWQWQNKAAPGEQ